MMTIQDNPNLGEQIANMPIGEEFYYATRSTEPFHCMKLDDKYVASYNADDDLLIFDVYSNCLSLGEFPQTNFYAVKKMLKGIRINNEDILPKCRYCGEPFVRTSPRQEVCKKPACQSKRNVEKSIRWKTNK